VAKQVPVGLGLATDRLTEITSGIEPGAQVVTQGQQDLADGDKVLLAPA
jgi:multidrug efflux pump subunit AcrA (membrane-fusion protein)